MTSLRFSPVRAYPQTIEPQKPLPRFQAGLPLSVAISRNQMYNRLIIKILGVDPWVIGFARNNYERVEKGFDRLCWLVMAFGLPIVFDKAFNGWYSRKLQKQYGFSQSKPLTVPLAWLDRNLMKSPQHVQKLQGFLKPLKKAVPLGKIAQGLLVGKLLIVLTDLLLMSSKSQVSYWGKNWLTEKLSKQKGFSGTFNDASEEYRKMKSKDYEDTKKQRLAFTLITSALASVALPLILYSLLKNPVQAGKGLLGKLKGLVPAFDYTDAIYMSKWTQLWFGVFSANLTSIVAARDNHERREAISRALAFDFFFFIGDEVFSGLGAKFLVSRYKKQLGSLALFKPKTILGLKNFPVAVPLHQVYHAVKGNTKHLAYRLARANYWMGMAMTTVSLGITLPLINNWYTRRKVREEENALRVQRHRPVWPMQTA